MRGFCRGSWCCAASWLSAFTACCWRWRRAWTKCRRNLFASSQQFVTTWGWGKTEHCRGVYRKSETVHGTASLKTDTLWQFYFTFSSNSLDIGLYGDLNVLLKYLKLCLHTYFYPILFKHMYWISNNLLCSQWKQLNHFLTKILVIYFICSMTYNWIHK